MDVLVLYVFFFFFKQKTAYEMRISDWSSDVCSSDLQRNQHGDQRRAEGRETDRFHPDLADFLVDRRADSAAVHAGRGRPAVPRVRHHPGGGDSDLADRKSVV